MNLRRKIMATGEIRPEKVLAVGQSMMAISTFSTVSAVVMAYGMSDLLSLWAQIVAHLAIPVAAAVFKLGYVVQLAAQHMSMNLAVGQKNLPLKSH
jgi:hypothetical protein